MALLLLQLPLLLKTTTHSFLLWLPHCDNNNNNSNYDYYYFYYYYYDYH